MNKTILILLMAAGVALAGEVTFQSLAPQTTDSPYELTQKQVAALAQIAAGGLTGGLTDAELRAAPVSVSLTGSNALSISLSGTTPVSGPLTDAELRAAPLQISGTTNSALVGTQRAVTTSALTTSGTLSAGARTATFVAGSNATATVGALPLLSGASLTIPAPTGDTLGAIGYTVTSGTLYLVEVR